MSFENILYYSAYAIILVVFYVVLKSPKKGDTSTSDKDNKEIDDK